MQDNPDYGTILFDLMTRAKFGDVSPLDAYLAAKPTRAATADHRCVLVVRQQYGTLRDGRWHGYSAQPDRNPWPGTPTRPALVLLRGGWSELTIPVDQCIDAITADGDTFRIRLSDGYFSIAGDEIFRVIADNAFGPPGFTEAEIARGFAKLAGRLPLEVIGPAEADAPLGANLPVVLKDPTLGWFNFRAERPAHYSQSWEDGPSYSLFADSSGSFDGSLARAREMLPGIAAQVAASARLVQAIKPDFGKSGTPRLSSAVFRHDGTVRITIVELDSFESLMSADVELETNGRLHLIEIDDN